MVTDLGFYLISRKCDPKCTLLYASIDHSTSTEYNLKINFLFVLVLNTKHNRYTALSDCLSREENRFSLGFVVNLAHDHPTQFETVTKFTTLKSNLLIQLHWRLFKLI